MTVLIQYWHDGRPDARIAALLDSFGKWNPELQRKLFDAGDAERLIGDRCDDRAVGAFRACAAPAMQADYFRYCAAHALGGICADADCLCLGSIAPLLDEVEAGRLFKTASGVLPNGLFGFVAPGHPLPAIARELATELIEMRFDGNVAEVTGPGIFTSLYWLHQARSISEFLRCAERGAVPDPGDLRDPALHGELRRASGLTSSKPGRLFRLAAEVAGGREGLERAFEGVRVSSAREALERWAAHGDGSARRDRGATHWRSRRRAIYRQLPSRST